VHVRVVTDAAVPVAAVLTVVAMSTELSRAEALLRAGDDCVVVAGATGARYRSGSGNGRVRYKSRAERSSGQCPGSKQSGEPDTATAILSGHVRTMSLGALAIKR